MLKRRLLGLAAAVVTVASATTAIAASSHSTAAAGPASSAAAASHTSGVVRVVRRGLVRDCVYIANWEGAFGIAGQGVNEPVDLAAPGNCFNLYDEFYYSTDGHTYTGYEYQNGDGHCLWNDGGTIELGAACQGAHTNEMFFGISLDQGIGWLIGNVTSGIGHYMAWPNCVGDGVVVRMVTSDEPANCPYWNFPSS
jgi:hypothetical protein